MDARGQKAGKIPHAEHAELQKIGALTHAQIHARRCLRQWRFRGPLAKARAKPAELRLLHAAKGTAAFTYSESEGLGQLRRAANLAQLGAGPNGSKKAPAVSGRRFLGADGILYRIRRYLCRGTRNQPTAHHQRLPAMGVSVAESLQQARLTVALNVVTEQQEFTGADADGRAALVDAEGETAGADGDSEHSLTR